MECPKCKENNEDLEKAHKNSPDWVKEKAYKLDKYNEHNFMQNFNYGSKNYHLCRHCRSVFDDTLKLTKITIV